MIYLENLGISLDKTEDLLKYLYRTWDGKDVLLSQVEYNCIKGCPFIYDSASKKCNDCKNNPYGRKHRFYILGE